jgi:hypothetical protein
MMGRVVEQQCSVRAVIATTVLSSHRVLGVLKSTPFHQPIPDLAFREACYLTYQPWGARYPDHVFHSAWAHLWGNGEAGLPKRAITLWSAIALRALAGEFLEPKHGALVVKLNKFGVWQQSVLSRISGVPVQAAARLKAKDKAYLSGEDSFRASRRSLPDIANRAGWTSPLISPHDAMVEDYIEREGLHETHLHLNGSTHAEVCWLRALHRPKAETKDFDQQWRRTSNANAAKVRELARAVNPEISPPELYRQLLVAAALRQWLIAAAKGCIADDIKFPIDYEQIATGSTPAAPEPFDQQCALANHSTSSEEAAWITALLGQLEYRPSMVLERMLHCYLVLQNQYYRLLVQSEEQYGFDQFQKITLTDLREPAEKDYLHRFQAMHGHQPNRSRIGYLEGRLSPKSTLRDNSRLLKTILGAYLQYLDSRSTHRNDTPKVPQSMSVLLDRLDSHFLEDTSDGRHRHKLALVAHFIKMPWSFEPAHRSGPYRFYKQRKDLESKAGALLQTLDVWPRLGQWLRGVDAAANELHAPPEVFASCFRICRQAGLTRRTYHAGEDFPHLLTGLRHMLDALELLDLRDGDRIGHGTAMGISPRLWIARMPGQLVISKGEWMLDLLGAWRMLRRLPDVTTEVHQVECELTELASHVFDREVSCSELDRAMRLRHLNIHFVSASRESSWNWQFTSLSDLWRAEARLVYEAQRDSRKDLELLWIWHSDKELWKRSEALCEVDTAFFTEKTFVRIQQVLMAEVSERKVVIETLPSSNVRISQYQHFCEHHALRWMRVPRLLEPNDPEIMVSLGSDDPGIFAGDLNGEFYQLYAALRNEGLGDKTALGYLAPINERGRQYRFHDPFLN